MLVNSRKLKVARKESSNVQQEVRQNVQTQHKNTLTKDKGHLFVIEALIVIIQIT
jgi:hypothetical protein